MRRIALIIIVVLIIYAQSAKADVANHLVISELKISGGTGKSMDEFIELYNPTDQDVSLSGWQLSKKTAAGSAYVLVDNFSDKTVKAHAFFLIAHPAGYEGSTTPDILYTTTNSLADNNAVILANDKQEIVDQVGLGSAVIFEGQAAGNPAGGKSLERKASADSTVEMMVEGGAHYFLGNGEDANDNKNDFILRSAPEPQNSQSELEYLSIQLPANQNTNTSSADDTNSSTTATNNQNINQTVTNNNSVNTNSQSQSSAKNTNSSPSSTKTLTQEEKPEYDFSNKILITELLPSCSPNDSQCEFIEIFNNDTRTINLEGWKLTDGKKNYFFPAKTFIQAKAYFVIERGTSKLTLVNKGASIFLVDPNKKAVNGVKYGSAKRDLSFARDGVTNNWQWTETVTKGSANELPEADEVAAAAVESEKNVQTAAKKETAADKQPIEIKIGDIAEDMLGQTLKISGEVESISAGGIYLTDEDGNIIRFYVQKQTGIAKPDVKSGDTVTVTGILDKTGAGLRLLPKKAEDIVVTPKEKSAESGQVLGVSTDQRVIDMPIKDEGKQVKTYLLIAAGAVGLALAWVLVKKYIVRAKD